MVSWNTSAQILHLASVVNCVKTDELITDSHGKCSTSYSSTGADISDDSVHEEAPSGISEFTNEKLCIYHMEAILTPDILCKREEISHKFAVIISEITVMHLSELEVGKFTHHFRLLTVPFVGFTCKYNAVCIVSESDLFSDTGIEVIPEFDDDEIFGVNTAAYIMISGLLTLLLPNFKGGLVSLMNFHKGHTSLQFSQLMITVLRAEAQLPLHNNFGELDSFFPERKFRKQYTKSRISKGVSLRNAAGVLLQGLLKISPDNIQKFQNNPVNDSILINEPASDTDRSLAQAGSVKRAVNTSKPENRGVDIRYKHQDNNGIGNSWKFHQEKHHGTADYYEFEKLEINPAFHKKQCSTELYARGVYGTVCPETIQESGSYIIEQHTTYSEKPEIWLEAPPKRQMPHHGHSYISRDNIASRHSTSETESDGRIIDSSRDPPGQQSVYIRPGDQRNESYRLSTFQNYPSTNPMIRKDLAKAGFSFTGYRDRVKCFACGQSIENWQLGDNAFQDRWHQYECPMVSGRDCGNVPIPSLFNVMQTGAGGNSRQYSDERRGAGLSDASRWRHGSGASTPAAVTQPSRPPAEWQMARVVSSDHRRYLENLFLNRELDRLASFVRWNIRQSNVSPASLAKTGFFYLGDMDRTQCFSCGGVLRNWALDHDAASEHRVHFPGCLMVHGREARNIPFPIRPETKEERERQFPCRLPSNPHMRNENTRLETFDRRWPMGRLAATPEQIAEAGFFFLGDRDRVKCWYCNGGLQNWDYEDDPFVEHAKWFPNCQFLLRQKGQRFVMGHLAANPSLARPIIAKQDGANLDLAGPGEVTENLRRPSGRNQESSNEEAGPVRIVDPREVMRENEELVKETLRNDANVRNVLMMGFAFDAVSLQNLLNDRGGQHMVYNRILGNLPLLRQIIVDVKAVIEDRVISRTPTVMADGICDSMAELLDDVMNKEKELRETELSGIHDVTTPDMDQAGPSSFGTASSRYSSMTTPSNISSIRSAPGSGKYNVSLIDVSDEEDVNMYESATSASELATNMDEIGSQQTAETMQETLSMIEEESLCKICYVNKADMLYQPCNHMCCCMECTQAIRHCPLCRVKIEQAIKTYLT